MVWAQEEVVIGRSCTDLFEFVSDVPRMPMWRATLLEATWGDGGPSRVGRAIHAVTKVAGRRFTWACEVTEWDPPNLFGYVARGVGNNHQEVSVAFQLAPAPGGCRLQMRGEAELPRMIAGLAGPVFLRLLLRENRIALHRLKSLVEGPVPRDR